jgi:hypothetical protein
MFQIASTKDKTKHIGGWPDKFFMAAISTIARLPGVQED